MKRKLCRIVFCTLLFLILILPSLIYLTYADNVVGSGVLSGSSTYEEMQFEDGSTLDSGNAWLLDTEDEDVITSEAGEPLLTIGVTTLQGFESHDEHVAFFLTEAGLFVQSEASQPLLLWNVEIEQATPVGDISLSGVGSSSTTEVLYNNAGTLDGIPTLTFDGSNTIINHSLLAGSTVSGVLTTGGSGGANNENLLWDFETDANIVGLTSSTGAARIETALPIRMLDGIRFFLGSAGDTSFEWETTGNDNLQLGIGVGSAAQSGYFSIMELTDVGNANRSPLATNADPVHRIYSSDATSAVDYGEFYHDQTDFNIVSGTGNIILSPASNSVTGPGGDLSLARISGSTFSTVQHLQDIFHSAGWVSGGGITDDADGTITVAAGTGLIRATDTAVAQILFMDYAAESGANVNLADNDISWVYVEYNSGTPQVIATTTERTDFNTNVLLAVIQRTGTTLHINNPQKHVVGDHANSMIRRLKETMKFAHVQGAIISATGTRNWAINTGDFWEGLGEFTLAAFDSSGADSFSYWYRQVSDSGWNEVATQSPIHQTNYDDNSGSLATLSNNKYGVHWCYIETDDHAHVVYGQGDYTLAEAEDALPPTGVPEPIEANGILIGKIIIREGTAAFTQIESAFGNNFTPSVAVDHGALVGLADDDHTQYLLADGSRALSGAWSMGSQATTNVNIDSGTINGITDLAIADGGTASSTAQAAIDLISDVSGATNEHVLTKDTGTGNAIWKVNIGSGITLGTEQASTSGTAIDFTSIPAGTKKITIMMVGVSTDGIEELLIQLGDSGGVETSGYLSTVHQSAASTASTAGFIVEVAGAATNISHGAIILFLEDSTDFTWVASSNINYSDTNIVNNSAGSKSLSAELDRVRITSTGTPDDFDAGAINIQYQ